MILGRGDNERVGSEEEEGRRGLGVCTGREKWIHGTEGVIGWKDVSKVCDGCKSKLAIRGKLGGNVA